MSHLGRYEILQRLARGSVADVLLARSSGLEGFQRHVVIKQIRAEHAVDARFVAAFLDEARIGAALHHHNIVQVFDIDEAQGGYFFAMEYVHGEDLRRVLAKVCATDLLVPIEQVVAVGAAAAAGLHHAHEYHGPDRKPLDLVHRDVSPSNILIGYDGSVKLVDFGLAKPALTSQNTRAGALGKAPYMSPELCVGKRLDRRSDIFALGTVLYELATARRLFKGTNDYQTMAMIVEAEVPAPSTIRADIPRQLDEIIMRCLAKAPEARYQTAYDLRNALETLAIDHELRTSAKSVADYLAKLFGARVEPWHLEHGKPEEAVDVDFDSRRGVLATPAKGTELVLALTPEAPIALAHDVALQPDHGGFDENPTRIDLPPETDETVTMRPAEPILPPRPEPRTAPRTAPRPAPAIERVDDEDDEDDEDDSDSAQTLDGSQRAILGDATTTTAQPIVDELLATGEQTKLRTAGHVLATAQAVTLNDTIEQAFGSRTGLTTEARTLEDAFPAGEAATIKDPPKRVVPVIKPRAPITAPVGPALAPLVDDATTVQPPLFTPPEPMIYAAAPPDYRPASQSTPSASASIQLPPLKRWGLVGAVLLIPLVIGLLAHACHADDHDHPPISSGP